MRILKELFQPKSVAVLGASRNPGKVGFGVFANLVTSGFPGEVYGVNPAGGEVLGRFFHRDIGAIPGVVDLGVFVIPPAAVVEAIPLLAEKGMKAAIVISAGFKEIGGEGALMEQALRVALARASVRAVGPNCLGVINTHARLNASFAVGSPPPGSIAFFSQSGALLTGVLDWAIGAGIGFSKVVSLGNKADISELDMMEFLSEDPETRVILGYVESIDEGRRFLRVAREATAKKPVILVKAGSTAAGARAASSHTGSLAGFDRAYSAAFRQGGVLRAGTVEELCDLALGFAMQPVPAGDRLLIVTNAGGPAIMAADAAERLGIPLAEVSPELRARLRTVLPPTASLGNPVDIIGDARSDRYGEVLRVVRDDPSADSVIVLLTPQAMTEPEETAREVVSALSKSGKTVLASFLGEETVRKARAILMKEGIPQYPDPDRAVRALQSMIAYRRVRGAGIPAGEEADGAPPPAVAAILRDALSGGRRTLGEEDCRGVLESYGFRFPRHILARTSVEAVAAFKEMGGEAAMKIVSPKILHKTEVGGVRLNLRSAEDVARAFLEITSSVRRMAPSVWIEGVSVQEMVKEGRELILGMSRDPQFGPLLMFGLGGIYVEVLQDITFRVAPVSRQEAAEMVREIRAYPLLAGFRGEEPADEGAIVEAILAVSRLSLGCPQILELDINPVMVLPKGRGIMAIDSRMSIGEA
ncbi:MAG: acetate--CoA ligase family protein [Candidatus Deferrimicrobiaceae bacterium]